MVLPRVRLAANIVELDCLSRVDAAVSKHGPAKLVCLEPNLSVDRSNGQTCAAASATAVPISEGLALSHRPQPGSVLDVA